MSTILMPTNGTMTPPIPQIHRLRRSRALAPTGGYATPLSVDHRGVPPVVQHVAEHDDQRKAVIADRD